MGIKTNVLAAVLASYLAGPPVVALEKPQCAPEGKVRFVTANIPQVFKEVEPNTYLIEQVGTAPGLAGKLTVYIPFSRDSPNRYFARDGLSIFDRRDPDPKKWYTVSNIFTTEGCADRIVLLEGPTPKTVTMAESQRRFNNFLDNFYKLIKTKSKGKYLRHKLYEDNDVAI